VGNPQFVCSSDGAWVAVGGSCAYSCALGKAFGGALYYLNTTRVLWSAAGASCGRWGAAQGAYTSGSVTATLASVESLDELVFINRTLDVSKTPVPKWIGGQRTVSGSLYGFSFVDGTVFDFQAAPFWQATQPDNVANAENCLSMGKSGGQPGYWYDINCDTVNMAFVCERPMPTVPICT